MKRIIGTSLTTLAFVAGALAMTGTTAHAVNCSTAEGYAKRTTASGATEFYEDSRCGIDPNRFTAPHTSAPTATGCRQYPDGELCGVGIGGPRPVISYPAFVRLYSVPGGTTAIGHVTVGGGSTPTGNVTIGELENVAENDEE